MANTGATSERNSTCGFEIRRKWFKYMLARLLGENHRHRRNPSVMEPSVEGNPEDLDAFLDDWSHLKKNFDYLLVNHQRIADYLARAESKDPIHINLREANRAIPGFLTSFQEVIEQSIEFRTASSRRTQRHVDAFRTAGNERLEQQERQFETLRAENQQVQSAIQSLGASVLEKILTLQSSVPQQPPNHPDQLTSKSVSQQHTCVQPPNINEKSVGSVQASKPSADEERSKNRLRDARGGSMDRSIQESVLAIVHGTSDPIHAQSLETFLGFLAKVSHTDFSLGHELAAFITTQ
ncbi:hypothetical protein EV127DRAFT_412321 [Xylaria flabelliformis]|nr:hypothetical protein EV127DRAFT_412321 [Xylaria flabelliformis]